MKTNSTKTTLKFRNWIEQWGKSLFPSGGMQGDGAAPERHPVPEDIEILPCGCARRTRLFKFWRIEVVALNSLEVVATYGEDIFCGRCGQHLFSLPSEAKIVDGGGGFEAYRESGGFRRDEHDEW